MRSLQTGIEDYVAMKRAMGFSFADQERSLLSFSAEMKRRRQKIITLKIAQSWARGNKSAPGWREAKKLGVLREFAIYWKTIEPKTETWPRKIWPMRYERVAPYIYSDAEISRLLRACLSLDADNKFRCRLFYALFGLIAACGLRLSEALSLTVEDIDLKNGIVTIRRTKFNKTRSVPLHETSIRELQLYARDRAKSPVHATSPFFVTSKGTRLTESVAEWTFNKIALSCGLRKVSRRGPRIHDLRHTFVVKTLERWYRADKDVESLLPILSTYVGHAQPASTFWYMSITPELMALARRRRDRYLGGLSQ